MLCVYGIKNCNTMKKAFDFLNDKNISFDFFDYKKQVIDFEVFCEYVAHFGIEKVINRQGTTYRKFDDETKAMLANGDLSAIYGIIKDNQSVLKRPIMLGQHQDKEVALIGFDENTWTQGLI